MSSGRFSMRGYASQGWRAAGRALANGGAGPPVAISTTHTTDALLSSATSRTHTTDASLKGLGLSRTHTTDALVRAERSLTHTADALLKAGQSRIHTTDALLKAGQARTHTTDALLKAEQARTHTTDASLKGLGLSKTHTTDAQLQQAVALTHTTNARLQQAGALTHTTNALLRAGQSKTHTTDALLKAEVAISHTTDARLAQQFSVQHTTDARLFALFVGSGNLVFGEFDVGGTADYDGPGLGNLEFGKFDLEGSGVFTPFYRPSNKGIEFPKFGVSGSGTVTPPIPNEHTSADVYKINRDYLRRDYGWGRIDRTLPYEWHDCCPGGEGAHPPLTKSCFINSEAIFSIHNFPNDISAPSIRWLTCCPPCVPIPSAGVPGPISPSSPLPTPRSVEIINVEIVHDLEDIKRLKKQRTELTKEIQSPPEVSEPFHVELRTVQYDSVPGSIRMIEQPTPIVVASIEEYIQPPQPTQPATVPVVERIAPVLPKPFNVEIPHKSKRGLRQSGIRIAAQKPQQEAQPEAPKIEYINNTQPTVSPAASTVMAVEAPVQRKSFSVGMRTKKRH